MASQYGVTVIDASLELSTVRVPTVQITAANHDAQMTAMTALRDGIAGIILGEVASDRRVAQSNFITRVGPSTTEAQREKKFMVVYEGTTTHKIYRTEIPTADLSLLSLGSDKIFPAFTGVVGTFVTAFEALVRQPGEAGSTVLYIEFVGKRT